MTVETRPDQHAVPPASSRAGAVKGARPTESRRAAWVVAARRVWGIVPAVALLAGLLLLWQWYASRPENDPQFLPTPLAVWSALAAQRAILWHHTLVTLWETVVGFAAALVAGVVCAVIVDVSPWLRRAVYPLLVASQTIPIITLAPLLVLWFGFGLTSKAIVILLVCFFPITVALADGLRSADPELVRLFRTFGAGASRIFWMVRLPGALPQLFSGIRIAITYSVIGAIFAEYVGASEGLGYYILLKQHSFATAGVMAAIVVTAVLSVALFALTALVERAALPWYYLQRRGSPAARRSGRRGSGN